MVLVSKGNFKGCCAGRTCRLVLCMAAKAAYLVPAQYAVRKVYICVSTVISYVLRREGVILYFTILRLPSVRVVELRVL